MELIPAIDLLGGRVVRLAEGAFDAVTEYDDDPVSVALRWQSLGASRLHVVDLDGARGGRAVQSDTVERLLGRVSIPCQVAGGIRGAHQVSTWLGKGVDRVVLGSALIADPTLAGRLVDRHGPERIVAALDVRDGRALGDGWVSGAMGSDAVELAERLATVGIRWFAVTAIARDGGLQGPDRALLAAVREAVPDGRIIASGVASSCPSRSAVARQPPPVSRRPPDGQPSDVLARS